MRTSDFIGIILTLYIVKQITSSVCNVKVNMYDINVKKKKKLNGQISIFQSGFVFHCRSLAAYNYFTYIAFWLRF